MRALALTVGDPSGIGPDIALDAWRRRHELGLPPFLLVGDLDMIQSRARRLGADVPLSPADFSSAVGIFDISLPVMSLGNRLTDTPGVPSVANAAGIIESIDRSVAAVQDGSAAAVVTLPIAKKVLYDFGFRFPGHTEYLAHLAADAGQPAPLAVMMIAGPDIRTVPVTIHIPLASVATTLTSEAIMATARVVHRDLRDRFGVDRPRLAVMGLNPHAGEDGSIGREDIDIVAPAIAELRAEGIDAFGPMPSDTMFHPRARATYDAAICMYHDQALIPAKTLAFDDAVNVTLGLPFVRTSPDHGTAFDIAGKGVARCTSLAAALRLAAQTSQSSHR